MDFREIYICLSVPTSSVTNGLRHKVQTPTQKYHKTIRPQKVYSAPDGAELKSSLHS